MTVASAHRTLPGTEADQGGRENGVDVIIGAAAWQPISGVIASYGTTGYRNTLDSSPFRGMDALLSIVQMPPGIPVATVSVGKAGARNAAILAIQIIARNDPKLTKKLLDHRQMMAKEVEEKAGRIAKKR
jgi:phosphoribosylaminoimidazole carboxylase PurE protein